MRILWSIVWISSMKIMAYIGIIAPKSLLSLGIECLICCFAAWFFAKHSILRKMAYIYLICQLITNFNLVGIYCFAMSMILIRMEVNKKKENEG